MLLEYFQMIDRVETVDLTAETLKARSVVPAKEPGFRGPFSRLSAGAGRASDRDDGAGLGFSGAGRDRFRGHAVPDVGRWRQDAHLRRAGSRLDIEAFLEHDGSGFAVTKAKITSQGKKVCDAQLKLRTMPFDQVPLGRYRQEACRRSGPDGGDCGAWPRRRSDDEQIRQ